MRIVTGRSIVRAGPAPAPEAAVYRIFADVERGGDAAVKKYERRFGARASPLRVSKREMAAAYGAVSAGELDAIKKSRDRLLRSERRMLSMLKGFVVRDRGVRITKRFIPLDSVGCYVPGGLADYPSSAIMSVTPASVAGVRRIVVVTPPGARGPSPATLVAADVCGATEIYKTGGAQAIAALSFGIQSIAPVDKIVGPGGRFVTAAKQLASKRTAIDMTAGPTELGIIADSSADARYIAADLISQAEHGADTTCYLITNSAAKAREVNHMLDEMTRGIPRGEIVRASLGNGFIAVCKGMREMTELANRLAPEHLEVMTRKPEKAASMIRTAGLVLVGGQTPSSAGDYLLGSNHILPTGRFGRARGALSVLDFVKLHTEVASTGAGLYNISGALKSLTDAEGLPNHYAALEERL